MSVHFDRLFIMNYRVEEGGGRILDGISFGWQLVVSSKNCRGTLIQCSTLTMCKWISWSKRNPPPLAPYPPFSPSPALRCLKPSLISLRDLPVLFRPYLSIYRCLASIIHIHGTWYLPKLLVSHVQGTRLFRRWSSGSSGDSQSTPNVGVGVPVRRFFRYTYQVDSTRRLLLPAT